MEDKDIIFDLVAKVASIETGIKNVQAAQERMEAMQERTEATFKQYVEKNDIEHQDFAKQKDLDALANRIRCLESAPDKQKAKVFDEVKKYVLTFLGGGLFLFLITNLNNILTFISALGRK